MRTVTGARPAPCNPEHEYKNGASLLLQTTPTFHIRQGQASLFMSDIFSSTAFRCLTSCMWQAQDTLLSATQYFQYFIHPGQFLSPPHLRHPSSPPIAHTYGTPSPSCHQPKIDMLRKCFYKPNNFTLRMRYS